MPGRSALPAKTCEKTCTNASDAHAASGRSSNRATSADQARSRGALTGTGAIGEKQAPRTPRTALSVSASPGSSRTKLLSKRSGGNAPSGSSQMGAGGEVWSLGKVIGDCLGFVRVVEIFRRQRVDVGEERRDAGGAEWRAVGGRHREPELATLAAVETVLHDRRVLALPQLGEQRGQRRAQALQRFSAQLDLHAYQRPWTSFM